jgi:lipoprotein-anchoring transpeptidase ErfK/SrfK
MSPKFPLAPKLMAALSLSAICAAVAVAAPAAAAARNVPATQTLVILDQTHVAFSRPDHRSTRVAAVRAWRPITGTPTVLPVIAHRRGTDGRSWLRVLLPGRPNGHAGWVWSRGSRSASTSWYLLAQTARRRITVYYRGRAVRAFRAVVGKPSTPTPHGRFFVEETVQLARNLVGAPFALALSARSNVLAQFDGGPGQIALHGLGNVGGVPGTAVSHGCLRLDYRSISWLARRIGPGVPVSITS